MSDTKPPHALDELQTKVRSMEGINTVVGLLHATLDAVGFSPVPEVQEKGLFSRVARHDKQLEDLEAAAAEQRSLLRRLNVYGAICCAAGIMLMAWVGFSFWDRYQDRYGTGEPLPAATARR